MGQNLAVDASTQINSIELSLKFPRSLEAGEASHLRGFFGRAFADEVMLHHHEADGRLRYAYPKVQFKVIDRTAHLVGLADGGPLVTRLWAEVDEAQIGSEVLPVLEAGLRRRSEMVGESESPVLYRFLTPWLGLNQANHARYEAKSDLEVRRALLEQAMVGNCLSLAKGLGHWVRARIAADCRDLRLVQVGLKGVAMIGFVGDFRANFHIPNHAGIGKSVSRGFGTVERVVGRPGKSEEGPAC
jgi:hypothetical protein